MAAFKELDVRSTSSIVRLIHFESIMIDSVDDDMAADLLLLPVVRHEYKRERLFHSLSLLQFAVWGGLVLCSF